MKTELNITPAGDELTIREGKAQEIKDPIKIHYCGDINTVSAFLNKRRNATEEEADFQYIDINKAVVLVDKEAMTIELQLDPVSPFGAIIKGKLELSDELKKFAINKSTTFTRDELIRLLKFSKIYFADAEQHYKVLTAYQSFTANANVSIEQKSDTRGNKTANFDKKVTTGLPDNFILSIPVFKGQEIKTFRVDIALDVTDGGGRFWFESVELHELMEFEKEFIIQKQLESCKDLVVINI